MTNPTLVTASAETPRWQHVLHRWPSALGLAAAAGQLATGGDRDSVAIVVGVATLCYLGAAALRRRWVAWAGVAGGSLVVAASELAGVVLAGHAVWDLIHYRRDQVVPRSLAEFCMLLDLPLGVGAIVIAVVD